jgi:DNA-binding GntR family transcriptional regulator
MKNMFNSSVPAATNALNTHLRVASKIRAAIQSGDFQEKLPTEDEFTQMYSVDRGVVRRALKVLRDEGAIETVQGLGSYVAGTGDRRPILERLRELLISDGYKPGDRLPTMREMCTRLGVSRPTLRHALAQLEGQGIVHISTNTRRGHTLLRPLTDKEAP